MDSEIERMIWFWWGAVPVLQTIKNEGFTLACLCNKRVGITHSYKQVVLLKRMMIEAITLLSFSYVFPTYLALIEHIKRYTFLTCELIKIQQLFREDR